MSVSVASYSCINLLFIIIIFFVLGLTALLNLASTSCIYFLKFVLSGGFLIFFCLFCCFENLSHFPFCSSKLASPFSGLSYLFKVLFRDKSLIKVILPAYVACDLQEIGIAWHILL